MPVVWILALRPVASGQAYTVHPWPTPWATLGRLSVGDSKCYWLPSLSLSPQSQIIDGCLSKAGLSLFSVVVLQTTGPLTLGDNTPFPCGCESRQT